jgi:hypothetical protein
MRLGRDEGLVEIVHREKAKAGASHYIYGLTKKGIKMASEMKI